MKHLRFGVVALLLAAVLATNAYAQEQDDYYYVLGSIVDPDGGLDLEDGTGFQIGAGWKLTNHWNLETYLQSTQTGQGPKHRHTQLGADLQLLMNRYGQFSPYVFGGTGFMSVDTTPARRQTQLGLSGGVGFRIKGSGDSGIALRGEYRYRAYDYLGTDLEDNLISLGIQIPFGKAAPPVVDSDGDGVADGMDRCPGTAAGRAVDSYGCELDSDGDGVADSLDRCPNTPAGVSVNSSGCPRDTDGDGVSDADDECPNTIAGATVDSRGCELDGDEDGVVDRLDQCPNSAPGVQVDIAGCEIKEEIELPGVSFESNSDRLLPGAQNVLDDAAATLAKNPSIDVEVAGHTDSDGAAEYNESLSARRAATVRDYLIGQGISANRMTTRGYGEANPIADNSTAAGKATNRRVVLRIIAR